MADELMKSGVPVILSTGYDPLGLAHLSKAAVLQKPFDTAALERAIAAARARNGAGGGRDG